MSATQTPEPSPPPAASERHCRRCGATLGPEQEWCLACGAAAETVVARPRGWRLPLMLAAIVVALAIAAAVLAIAEAASRGPEKVAVVTPTPAPTTIPSVTPAPSTAGAPETEGDQAAPGAATPTPSPGATATPSPGATSTPSPSTASFPDWPAGRTAWTVILKSASARAGAESAAGDLQSKGDTVGVLNSSDHSSLNPGYWVVYSGQYDSKSAAQSGLDSLPSKPADAYVRKVSAT